MLFLLLGFVLSEGAPVFTISLNAALSELATGRVRLYISKDNSTEPRFQDDDDQQTCQLYGVDVANMKQGESVVVDQNAFGYPIQSLNQLSPGQYYVQADLFRYKTYNRAVGPPVMMPYSCVSNDDTFVPNGTVYSQVLSLNITQNGKYDIQLVNIVPFVAGPGCAGLGPGVDSDYIKTVKIQSNLLTQFWGEPITLEACVLLPWGWDTHPTAKYPLVIAHGHYSPQWEAGPGFSETPPDPCDMNTDYDCVDAWYSYWLYTNWTQSQGVFTGARMMVATILHPVPLFDDSYAVNSANLGPYGDAINYELVPAIESKFRGIGQGWARGLYGGSTGGWESLAVQVLYPDYYNSAFAACPDPITFTSYETFSIYNTTNAYYYDSVFKKTARPGQRDAYSGMTIGYGVTPYGRVAATIEESNHHELTKGAKSRSCGQWDIWEAVFSPMNSDGFPQRLYDKQTGAMNATTAQYWRENYDLVYIMQRDWATLGPKLVGKIHLFAGNDDTWYLNNAVMDAEDWLETTTNPYYDGEIVIGVHDGRGFQHCFRGYEYDSDGNPLPNSITRETYNQAFLPEMADFFVKTAPQGADVTSWRY